MESSLSSVLMFVLVMIVSKAVFIKNGTELPIANANSGEKIVIIFKTERTL